MTIRSMPPASSHLADRPVPAPPPTIGWPLAIMSPNFWRIVLRATRGIWALLLLPPRQAAGRRRTDDVLKGGDRRRGEFGIVDMMSNTDQPAVSAGPKIGGDDIEQGLVRARIPEWLVGRIDARDAAVGDQEAYRPLHAVELVDNEPTDSSALLGGGAHQGHVVVVLVERAAAELRRHGIHGPEVHHVEGAARADIGHARA